MPQLPSPHDATYTADGGDKPRDAGDAEKLQGEFGRYRIEESLGSGAMGIVYRAFDPDLERKVALKVLRIDTSRDARIRFLREARAMAKVSHRNVVAVHEVGSVDGRDFIAMELIEGDNLAEWQRKQQRDPKLVVSAFIAAAQGLAAAHAKGLVHRDFKPHNVLRSEDGRVLVTDFGLARSVDDQSNSIDPMAATQNIPSHKIALALASSSSNELTRTGALLGTPAYMAPEQWNGDSIGPEADQYALCVALWEALAGQRPYQGVTLADLRTQVTAGPDKLDGSMIPRPIRRVLMRGMQVDPKKRWPSMAALLHALTGKSRTSSIALIALASIAAAAVAFAVLQGPSASGCPAAVISPDGVWNDSIAQAMRSSNKSHAADLLQTDFQRWQTLRSNSCKLTEKERAPRLSCLDGVLARLASTTAALRQLPVNVANFEPLLTTVDPSVCDSPTPPQLESHWPDNATAVVAMQHRIFEAPSTLSQPILMRLESMQRHHACLR
jgi:eukaryotic-like serine/threonine-protein kinase